MKNIIIAALFGAVALAAHADPAHEAQRKCIKWKQSERARQENILTNPVLYESARERVAKDIEFMNDFCRDDAPLRQKPQVGMTWKEVLQSSWGQPTTSNSTRTASGSSRQWVYRGLLGDAAYIYFDGITVTAIQE